MKEFAFHSATAQKKESLEMFETLFSCYLIF